MVTKKFIGGVSFLSLVLLLIACAFIQVGGMITTESTTAQTSSINEEAVLVPMYLESFSMPEKVSTLSYIEKINVKEVKEGEVKKKAKEVKKEVKEEKEKPMSDDLYWLSKIVYAEARGEDDKGQRLVAEVVINRLNNPYFPDTIKDVIFQDNGKQFQPVMDGSIDLTPDERAIENARFVLENGTSLTTEDILYFHAKRLGKTRKGTKWWDGVVTAFVHEGHVFARELPED